MQLPRHFRQEISVVNQADTNCYLRIFAIKNSEQLLNLAQQYERVRERSSSWLIVPFFVLVGIILVSSISIWLNVTLPTCTLRASYHIVTCLENLTEAGQNNVISGPVI